LRELNALYDVVPIPAEPVPNDIVSSENKKVRTPTEYQTEYQTEYHTCRACGALETSYVSVCKWCGATGDTLFTPSTVQDAIRMTLEVSEMVNERIDALAKPVPSAPTQEERTVDAYVPSSTAIHLSKRMDTLEKELNAVHGNVALLQAFMAPIRKVETIHGRKKDTVCDTPLHKEPCTESTIPPKTKGNNAFYVFVEPTGFVYVYAARLIRQMKMGSVSAVGVCCDNKLLTTLSAEMQKVAPCGEVRITYEVTGRSRDPFLGATFLNETLRVNCFFTVCDATNMPEAIRGLQSAREDWQKRIDEIERARLTIATIAENNAEQKG